MNECEVVCNNKSGSQANTTLTEEEAGLEGAVADDADAEYVRSVCERDIVGAAAALRRYLPLLRALLAAPRAASRLHAAAALAYTRYTRTLLSIVTQCKVNVVASIIRKV